MDGGRDGYLKERGCKTKGVMWELMMDRERRGSKDEMGRKRWEKGERSYNERRRRRVKELIPLS